MKDHGQQARASENFAGPVDFETPRPSGLLAVVFHKPWLEAAKIKPITHVTGYLYAES